MRLAISNLYVYGQIVVACKSFKNTHCSFIWAVFTDGLPRFRAQATATPELSSITANTKITKFHEI